MRKTWRNLILVSFVLIFIAGIFSWRSIMGAQAVPKNLEDPILLIPQGANFEQVLDSLQKRGCVSKEKLFISLADYMKYRRDPMRPGRFTLKPGMSYIQLIRHLRNGPQTPVRVVLTNERLPEDIAGKVAKYLETDSLSLWSAMQDQEILSSLELSPESLTSLFIPNTYELYWNTSPEDFLKRMKRESDKFWSNNQRQEKAEKLGMDKNEVYTLASIVEKETLRNDEKTRMAGVYLNRLKTGMLLQADPTAVFATRDFGTARVLDFHTNFDSPYNTYKYPGLPPGPISMASISSIDAVLNAEDHDYLFFCAIGDGSGYHAFAKTLSQHNQNAVRYRNNLKKRGLR
jgi:UPF0755 protein